MIPVSLRWQDHAAGHLELLDQTLLPTRLEWIACRDVDTLVEAIKSLRVRGAPAIDIAGAYGRKQEVGQGILGPHGYDGFFIGVEVDVVAALVALHDLLAQMGDTP